MRARAVLSALLCLVLAACGGGTLTVLRVGSFKVFKFNSGLTSSPTVVLTGSGFVPVGAACTFATSAFAPPSCSCSFGPIVAGHWTNAATGAAGRLELTVIGNASCNPVETLWRTPTIVLAPGHNQISLSLADSTTEGGAVVTVVRN